jgi:HTH-type transcriptional regulator/antitoxin HigA
MDISIIRTDEDYENTLAEIEQLMEANVEPGTVEGDRLELLIVLIRAYESEHYPIPFPDPIEAIEYYMDSRNLTRADLEPFIGTRARVYEILNRKRPLTLRMIRKLSDGLGIPAHILIQPYELDPSENPLDILFSTAVWTNKSQKRFDIQFEILGGETVRREIPISTLTSRFYQVNRSDTLQ